MYLLSFSQQPTVQVARFCVTFRYMVGFRSENSKLENFLLSAVRDCSLQASIALCRSEERPT
jgi:hypothetical protein